MPIYVKRGRDHSSSLLRYVYALSSTVLPLSRHRQHGLQSAPILGSGLPFCILIGADVKQHFHRDCPPRPKLICQSDYHPDTY